MSLSSSPSLGKGEGRIVEGSREELADFQDSSSRSIIWPIAPTRKGNKLLAETGGFVNRKCLLQTSGSSFMESEVVSEISTSSSVSTMEKKLQQVKHLQELILEKFPSYNSKPAANQPQLLYKTTISEDSREPAASTELGQTVSEVVSVSKFLVGLYSGLRDNTTTAKGLGSGLNDRDELLKKRRLLTEDALEQLKPHKADDQPLTEDALEQLKPDKAYDPPLTEDALEQLKPHEADDPPLRCYRYCSLFPVDYEFEEDTLIQLWMAEGFIEEKTNERLEDTGRFYFHCLVAKGFIVPSSCDFIDARPKYKVSDKKGSSLQQFSLDGYLLVEDVVARFELSDKLGDGTELLHLSLHAKIDSMNFKAVKTYENLHTLLIFPPSGSCIKQIPRDLFLRLNILRTLKLSQTHISELPSSIANVKSLRYIDVSETLITTLPESTNSLYNLQTLKLRGCTCFVALPKGMKNLTNLRYLDLDIIGQLISMPPGMGNLINLQTLSAFLVGRHDGCRIDELKNLNNLSGEFCISRLENVSNSEEAMEAALVDKKYLNKLELRWSDVRVEMAEKEEAILEWLRPHSGLKELQILFFGGSKLASWIGHPSFSDLVAITLHKFKNCQLLPSLGELPSLKFLYIAEMNAVREVNYRFCRSREDLGYHAFPKLEILKFEVMLKLEGWIGVQNGDFPSLMKLALDYCPKLIALPPLSFLNSLKHLEIKYCPNLISMPNEGLPSSLEVLLIKECPELKEQCSKGKGRDWCKIAHVPRIWVDNQEISAS